MSRYLRAQGGDFGHRLLHIVFAKGSLAGCSGLGHGVCPLGFGDGQQAYAVCWPPGLFGRPGDALLYLCQCLCDFVRNK